MLTTYILAFILDIIIGDPHEFPHPVKFIGKVIDTVNRFLFIPSSKEKEFIKGIILFFITVSITFFVVTFFLKISFHIGKVFFLIVNIYFLYTAIALRDLRDSTIKIYKALEKQDIKLARFYLSYVVGRDTENLSEEEIVRGTVETIAEGFADGVVAPVFYFLLGGNVLSWIYKAVNTLDSMVGYNFFPYKYYGRFSAKVDDIFNFIPSRIAALLILLWGLITGKNFLKGLKIFLRDRKNHPSPNGGNPESAMAGILGVRIGGVNYYKGHKSIREYIGNPDKKLRKDIIKEAINILYGASFLLYIIGIFILFKGSYG